MIPALSHIINKDQRGFMKDRRISVNIRKMLDIMHQADEQDLEAIVLSLDFVKCFDECSFSILHGSLEYFGFGQIVKDWTKILYKDFLVKIQNNGYFSQSIDIKKGVHQGGCCSSIYFLVIAEILAISLRSNEEIEGITINEIRNLLNQFADDMDVISICTEKSLRAIYRELDEFHYQSGFTVSYEKTTLYRIGSLRNSSAVLYDMKQYAWSNNDINVLGITISHEEVVNKNYEPIVEKVRKTLGALYNRGLTLLGKIRVVNTLVASLFVYKMMVLPMIPQVIVKKVDSLIIKYLWEGKKSKISYKILQNLKQDGGLGLVNLANKDIALKATWPSVLKTEEQYAQLVYKTMRCAKLQEDIWRCTLLPEDIKGMNLKNQFWSDVLVSWNEYNFYNDHRIENQLIWYNSYIRIQDKPFMWRDAYEKGLKYVHQLFSNKAFKSSQEITNEFGISEMRYNSIKAAIPQKWKEFFRENELGTFSPLPPHNYDTIESFKNLSKKVYEYINGDIQFISKKFNKWNQEKGYPI